MLRQLAVCSPITSSRMHVTVPIYNGRNSSSRRSPHALSADRLRVGLARPSHGSFSRSCTLFSDNTLRSQQALHLHGLVWMHSCAFIKLCVKHIVAVGDALLTLFRTIDAPLKERATIPTT